MNIKNEIRIEISENMRIPEFNKAKMIFKPDEKHYIEMNIRDLKIDYSIPFFDICLPLDLLTKDFMCINNEFINEYRKRNYLNDFDFIIMVGEASFIIDDENLYLKQNNLT